MEGAEVVRAMPDIGINDSDIVRFRQMKYREAMGVNLSEKDLAASKDERQQRSAIDVIFAKYDIIRVRSMNAYYYRDNDASSYTYSKADDQDLDFKKFVKDAYRKLGIATTGKKINNTVETLKEEVDNEVETIDTNIVEITDGWYWDGYAAELTQTPSHVCFLRLFDNRGQSSPSTIEVDTSMISPKYIKGMCEKNLKWLNMLEGNLPTPKEYAEVEKDKDYPLAVTFEFIDTWACGRADVYNDLLKAAATIFMKNKPVGAFVLTGLRRNGKSSYVKMLHTLLGRANTSSLRLVDLSSRHRNLTLTTSMMNAPDEETEGKDMDDEATANFKSMAAHEPIQLPVMYSSKPQWISTNFTMFCPMNTEPKWKGNSASACYQRSLIIPFYADLSKFDNNGKDFARETFTAYMYNDLLSALFAMAMYYKDKPMDFGETMKQTKQVIEEKADSRVAYARLFVKWFCGYHVIKDVWVDYRAWCKMYGYEIVGQNDLAYALSNIGNGTKRTKINRDYADGRISAVRIGDNKKDNFFFLDDEITELRGRTIGDIIYVNGNENDFTGNSVVESLERWYEQKGLVKAKNNEVEDGE